MIAALHQLVSIARAGALKHAHVKHAGKLCWIGRECALVRHGGALTLLTLPEGRTAKSPCTAPFMSHSLCVACKYATSGLVCGM